MKIEEVVQIMKNRLATLQLARTAAVINGDLAQVNSIDLEILETQSTLDTLEKSQAS